MPDPHVRGARTPPASVTRTAADGTEPIHETELVADSRPIDDTEPIDVPSARAVRGKRVRRVALGTLLAVGLAGAAGIGAVGWNVLGQTGAVLDPPEHVAGLTRDDSKRAQDLSEYLRTVLSANVDLGKSTGVVYADPASRERTVLLFGGTALLWRPERTLDGLFTVVAGDSSSVRGLREFPAGRLGGVLKCARTTSPDGDITICGWADHGSVALGMFPARNLQEAASLLRRIREATQTRQ